MIEETIKKIICEGLEEKKIEVDKIILFGSRARNDYKKVSDWDLLIVVKKELSRKEKSELSHFIRRKLADKFIPCDVLVRSQEEEKKRSETIGSVIRTAVKEGVIL